MIFDPCVTCSDPELCHTEAYVASVSVDMVTKLGESAVRHGEDPSVAFGNPDDVAINASTILQAQRFFTEQGCAHPPSAILLAVTSEIEHLR